MFFEIAHIATYALLFMTLYFEVFLLLLFLDKHRTPHTVKSPDPAELLTYYPSVSIIIPAYNEEQNVSKTVNSLLNLHYPKDKLSIVAVDDGSTDNTLKALRLFENNPQITVLHKENGGKHTALNMVIERCESDIVGCLDSDSTVDSNALLEIIRVFQMHKEVDAVTPAIVVRDPKTLIQRIQSAEYTLAVFIRQALSLANAQFVTPGPFSLFRREIFSRVGLYKKAHNTEDLEMALRIQKAGGVIANAPHAVVYTNSPSTIPALIRQRVRWTYGFLRNLMDNKDLFGSPRFGDLGLLVLPTATVSIFGAVFLFAFMIFSTLSTLFARAVEYRVAGFAPSFSFEWFFISTKALLFVTFFVLLLTAVLITLGARISRNRVMWGETILYLTLYGFIAPLWLAKSAYRAIRSTEPSWQAERN